MHAHRLRSLAPLLLAAAVLVPAALAPGAQAATKEPQAPTAPVACAPRPATSSTVGGPRLAQPGLQLAAGAAAAAAARPPKIAATAWIVADLTTGDVIAACNAHVRLRPASTLKVLTALSLVETLNPQAPYTATSADAAIEGSKVGLVPGSQYTVLDLLHGLMLPSGNDAANAFAALAGGMPAATARMNAEARRLQADDTLAMNTSGLDADGQVTSAYDLALFGREALRRPWLATVVSTRSYSFPGAGTIGGARARFQIQNHNRLLGTFAGTTGVKNGYTTLAQGTLVASATRGGHSYVATVVNAGRAPSTMAEALLTWAFAGGATAAPVGRLADPRPDGSSATPTPSGTPSGTLTSGVSGTPTPTPSAFVPTASATSPSATVGDPVSADPIRMASASQDQVPRLVALGYIAAAVLIGLGLGVARIRARDRATARARNRAVARR